MLRKNITVWHIKQAMQHPGGARLRAHDTLQEYDPYIHKDGPHPELCVPEAAAEVLTEAEVGERGMG